MPTFSESGACVEADKLAQPEAAGGVSDNESDNGDDGREAYDGDEPTSADGDEGEHPEERQNFAALQDGFNDDAALQEAMRQSLVSVKISPLGLFWCSCRAPTLVQVPLELATTTKPYHVRARALA